MDFINEDINQEDHEGSKYNGPKKLNRVSLEHATVLIKSMALRKHNYMRSASFKEVALKHKVGKHFMVRYRKA